MAGLSWVHWLGLLLAVASSGAQIFPFSNLKHMFEQKGKAGQGAARAPPPVTTPSPLGSPGFVPTLEPSTTTLEPTTTVGPVSGLAPYYGPYSLFDEDDGYREFQRPDLVVTERARPLPKASKPTAAAKPKHQAAATHPKHSPSATKQTPPSRLAASKPTATATAAAGQQAKHKKRLVESHLHAVPPAGRPSHYVPIKIAAAESSAAAAIALGPPQRTPANHRPGLRPQPQHQQQLQQQAPRAPKFKNHKQGPVAAPSAPRPVKYHNHRPGSLDGEESSTSLRYRKRPLGPIEQEVASSGIQHTGKYPSSGDGDRVEFQMHGLQGPESYKFGYDTGSGHNRQFRYEERDPHGNVKGHYGYVDEHGKLQIVNYKADPHHGYSADVSKLHT